ncbi:MAG: DUF1330 domain-containing protein [Dehalococcoidia bacterium]|nr:DUF1330 domain-containing protein [Dehalococcoidia bacterium]
MAAYAILHIDITDPALYAEYVKLAPATVEQYGGRYVVRGGKCETTEGEWSPQRVVVLSFDTVEQAKRWWDSPEYRPAREMRHRAATSKMMIVEGV